LRQVLGQELKYFVHRDAERLGDLLHMLIAKRFADLIRRDRQVVLVLIEPGLHLRLEARIEDQL
jgi:hypothetical protein